MDLRAPIKSARWTLLAALALFGFLGWRLYQGQLRAEEPGPYEPIIAMRFRALCASETRLDSQACRCWQRASELRLPQATLEPLLASGPTPLVSRHPALTQAALACAKVMQLGREPTQPTAIIPQPATRG